MNNVNLQYIQIPKLRENHTLLVGEVLVRKMEVPLNWEKGLHDKKQMSYLIGRFKMNSFRHFQKFHIGRK